MDETIAPIDEKIDCLEAYMYDNMHLIDAPVTHTFTTRMYIREICMPTGAFLTSKIHKTEHPYVVLSGCAFVYSESKDKEELYAGHSGITEPNTRRVLYITDECRWATYHVLSDEEEEARLAGADVDTLLTMIEGRIIEKRMIPGDEKQTMFDMYKDKLEEQGAACLGQQ